jgi:hypothetical protein
LQVELTRQQLEKQREHLAEVLRRLNRTVETIRRAERALGESNELLLQFGASN